MSRSMESYRSNSSATVSDDSGQSRIAWRSTRRSTFHQLQTIHDDALPVLRSFIGRWQICIVFICTQTNIRTINIHNRNDAVSGRCQKHTGYHSENANACPELFILRLDNGQKNIACMTKLSTRWRYNELYCIVLYCIYLHTNQHTHN